MIGHVVGAILLALSPLLLTAARRHQSPERAVLLRAAELVEAGWTQRAGARDCEGQEVDVASSQACSFCATGAITRAALELEAPTAVRYESQFLLSRRLNLRRANPISTWDWNDKPRRTAAQVAKAIREAANL